MVGIHCRDLVLGLGTLHCMTQQNAGQSRCLGDSSSTVGEPPNVNGVYALSTRRVLRGSRGEQIHFDWLATGVWGAREDLEDKFRRCSPNAFTLKWWILT